jgi:hypothetical protein
MQLSPASTRYSGSSRPLALSLTTRIEPASTKGKPRQGWRSSNTAVAPGTVMVCMASTDALLQGRRQFAEHRVQASSSSSDHGAAGSGPAWRSPAHGRTAAPACAAPCRWRRRAGGGERRGKQDVVDAQAAIEAEAHLPVIPPGIELFGGCSNRRKASARPSPTSCGTRRAPARCTGSGPSTPPDHARRDPPARCCSRRAAPAAGSVAGLHATWSCSAASQRSL